MLGGISMPLTNDLARASERYQVALEHQRRCANTMSEAIAALRQAERELTAAYKAAFQPPSEDNHA